MLNSTYGKCQVTFRLMHITFAAFLPQEHDTGSMLHGEQSVHAENVSKAALQAAFLRTTQSYSVCSAYTELKPKTERPLRMTSLPSWSSRVGPLGPLPVDSGSAAASMLRWIS